MEHIVVVPASNASPAFSFEVGAWSGQYGQPHPPPFRRGVGMAALGELAASGGKRLSAFVDGLLLP